MQLFQTFVNLGLDRTQLYPFIICKKKLETNKNYVKPSNASKATDCRSPLTKIVYRQQKHAAQSKKALQRNTYISAVYLPALVMEVQPQGPSGSKAAQYCDKMECFLSYQNLTNYCPLSKLL